MKQLIFHVLKASTKIFRLSALIWVLFSASWLQAAEQQKGKDMSFTMQAVMQAQPGKGEILGQMMTKASQLVSSAKGCKAYIVQLSTSEPDTILITEVWDSPEDHRASLGREDIRALITEAKPLIASMSHQTGTLLGAHGL